MKSRFVFDVETTVPGRMVKAPALAVGREKRTSAVASEADVAVPMNTARSSTATACDTRAIAAAAPWYSS